MRTRVLIAATTVLVGCAEAPSGDLSGGAAKTLPSRLNTVGEDTGYSPDLGSSDLVVAQDPRGPRILEVLRIDGVAENLTFIDLVAPRNDGVTAISQPPDRLIRFYSSTGSLLGTFGRPGQGPGEFSGMSRMGWIGDTLWVFDFTQQRMTFVSPDLALIRVASNLPRMTLASTSDGGFISDLSSTDLRFQIDRWNANGSGEPIFLALVPEGENSMVRHSNGTVTLPFGNTPQYSVSQDGKRIAIAMAEMTGERAKSFWLVAVDSRGDTLVSRNFPFQAERVSDAVWDSVVSLRVSQLERAGVSGPGIDILRRARPPQFFPPLRRLMLGNDGSFWIELRAQGDSIPYFVVDPSGDPIGTMSVPARNRIAAATSTREIWVIEPDETDVEDAVKYSVEW